MTPLYTSIIAAIPPTIAAIAALIVSIHNANRIQDVHLSLNSRLDQLVNASLAQGRQDERDSHSVTVAGVPKKEQENT